MRMPKHLRRQSCHAIANDWAARAVAGALSLALATGMVACGGGTKATEPDPAPVAQSDSQPSATPAARELTATTMRVADVTGDATLASGDTEMAPFKGLSLHSGDALATEAASTVAVDLDATKFVTLEELSRAEFAQDGKALTLHLAEGDLFFNVTDKLGDDESMEIETSTIAVGIRGTSGYVRTNADGEDELWVTDGEVVVRGTNPVTGEVDEAVVRAGEHAKLYLDSDRSSKTATFELDEPEVADLPAALREHIAADARLLERVTGATSWERADFVGNGTALTTSGTGSGTTAQAGTGAASGGSRTSAGAGSGASGSGTTNRGTARPSSTTPSRASSGSGSSGNTSGGSGSDSTGTTPSQAETPATPAEPETPTEPDEPENPETPSEPDPEPEVTLTVYQDADGVWHSAVDGSVVDIVWGDDELPYVDGRLAELVVIDEPDTVQLYQDSDGTWHDAKTGKVVELETDDEGVTYIDGEAVLVEETTKPSSGGSSSGGSSSGGSSGGGKTTPSVASSVVTFADGGEDISGNSLTYDGTTHVISIASITLNGTVLKESTDYTLTYAGETSSGTGDTGTSTDPTSGDTVPDPDTITTPDTPASSGVTVQDANEYTIATITGIGSYTGTLTVKFTVDKAEFTKDNTRVELVTVDGGPDATPPRVL